MALIDCCIINNELNMLKFRVELLDKYMDRFVVVEANHTHRGVFKGFNFTQEQLSEINKKISYIQLDLTEAVKNFKYNQSEAINYRTESWKLENFHRNAIMKGLTDKCKLNDFIFLSDLDEIPDLKMLKVKSFGPIVYGQTMYYYSPKFKNLGPQDKVWPGTIRTTYELLCKESPQSLRNKRYSLPVVPGGWHFSYFGNIEEKMKCIVDAESVLKLKGMSVEDALKNAGQPKDLYGRETMKFETVDPEKEFPEEVLNSLKKYFL